MADISKITLPDNGSYDIKDAKAREDIAALQASLGGGIKYIGVTTTSLTDDSTTSSIQIGDDSITPKQGDLVIYDKLEFIYDGKKWHEFGSTGSLKALAFKDNATGNFTPTGTVTAPTFEGTSDTVSVTGTPSGTVTISTGTGKANYTPAGTISTPDFTGTEDDVSVNGIPTGTVTVAVGDGTPNYTPAGTNSAPKTTVALNTTTVNSITNVGSLPSCTFQNYKVANETLTITDGSFSPGTLPTKGSDVTVATSVKSATTTAPMFTGTGAELKATFIGTNSVSTGKFTPSGTITKPTFTGTGKELVATFNGAETTSTGEFTPAGTVTKPTFAGSEGKVTVS